MKHNLICVHSGNSYAPEYVLNLWKGATINSCATFEFYVFTDNVQQHPQDLGWHFVQLPNWSITGFKPWWYKLEIFNHRHQLLGNNLYIDLDTVIVGNIDDFWQYYPAEFRICHDFNRAFSKNINWSNSSIMAWPGNSMSWLHSEFSKDMQNIVKRNRGDQDFIHAQTRQTQKWWPRKWAMSWKWEVKHGGLQSPQGNYYSDQAYIIHPDTRIVVCHGKPDPHEITELTEYWHK